MNALAKYFLVFLLGWSGAVWTYSDLIYKKVETPTQTTSSSESPVGDSEQPIEEQTIDQDAQPVQKQLGKNKNVETAQRSTYTFHFCSNYDHSHCINGLAEHPRKKVW